MLALVLCAGTAQARTRKTSSHKSTPASSKQAKSTKPSTSAKSAASKKNSKRKTKARARGQQGIDSTRIRQIQEALIREKYMDGEPSGVWDQRTKNAMTRYQSDNGWQSKVLPDSRALIKLGLGPDHSKLINPDTAATSSTASAAGRQR